MGHRNRHRGRYSTSWETEGKEERRKSKLLRRRRKRQRRFRRQMLKVVKAVEGSKMATRYNDRTYRACLSKRYFPTEESADRWARYYSEKYGSKTSIYKCEYCDGWHLTTHPKEEA